MLGALILLLVLIAGMLFAAKLAREQGGRELGWAIATLLAGLLGHAAGAYLLVLAFAKDSLGLLAAHAGPVLALVFQATAIFALHALAKGKLQLRGDRWPVYRLSDEHGEGCQGELRLAREEVVFAPREGSEAARIPYPALTRCEVDGECLHLVWGGGELLLQPGANDLVSAARTRLSEALCRELERRRPRGGEG